MAPSRRPTSTGDEQLDELVESVLDRADPDADRDLLREILVSAVRLTGDRADRLDLKIVGSALAEMRRSFTTFAPYRGRPKVTIFGSARTRADDPLYAQARDLAHELARLGWMVVTGAGPGIMTAGAEGAGRENSIGVNIRLPFEQEANEFLAEDMVIDMKYFFTRKLALVKESQGFVCLPGGFGTMDETFELLTLQQTGKSDPAPIVFLDTPGGTYWASWHRFVIDELEAGGMISPGDDAIFLVTDDVAEACQAVVDFYRNYHSVRWVGNRLVIRLRAEPSEAEMAELSDRFGAASTTGTVESSGPLGPEVADGDALDLARVAMDFEIRHFGELHALIDMVNGFDSAPAEATPPQL